MDQFKIKLMVTKAEQATTKKARKEILTTLYKELHANNTLPIIMELQTALTAVEIICKEANVKVYNNLALTIETRISLVLHNLYLADKLTIKDLDMVNRKLPATKRSLTQSSYCSRGVIIYLTEKTMPLWLKIVYYKETLKATNEPI